MGEIVGAGTLQLATGEIDSCDIEISILRTEIDNFITLVKRIGIIPKGSYVEVEDQKIEVGEAEGLGLYLNGTDLNEEVYRNSNIDDLIEELQTLVEGHGALLSHWEGSTETALYFYGKSYEEMKDKMKSVIDTYPLCEKCRVVQIA